MMKNNIKYKVCILAAGVGDRMGNLTANINKAILPVNFKAVVSHVIEKFPKDIEIVIAVGYKKDIVKNYLLLAYPDRKFTFVEIDRYSGPNTGPGYSLLKCKDYLQLPFIFIAADTIVLEEIPIPDYNWFGIAPVKDPDQYCTVRIKNNLIYHLDVKVRNNNRFAFIGLAGIRDYIDFFKALGENNRIVKGELQVIDGFEGLIEKGLVPVGFTWFDTGTLKKYQDTNKHFSSDNQKFDFSKSNEFLYFVGDKVIKFFADENIAQKRYMRASEPLKGLTPKIEDYRGQFYSYRKVSGQVLYDVLNLNTIRGFLRWAHVHLWKKILLTKKEEKEFYDACRKFYLDKTKDRLKMFNANKNELHNTKQINDITVPFLDDLLARIDWDYLSHGFPSNFHGDLQFDNILVSTNADGHSKNAFVLLDWRQDFGGLTNVGDLYYDLAKLYGGILLPYNLIKEGMFSFEADEKSVHYTYFTKHNLFEAKEEFERFVSENGFDLRKIKILTSLIFLNMSPLHAPDFDSLLYHLGRYMLHNALKYK